MTEHWWLSGIQLGEVQVQAISTILELHDVLKPTEYDQLINSLKFDKEAKEEGKDARV